MISFYTITNRFLHFRPFKAVLTVVLFVCLVALPDAAGQRSIFSNYSLDDGLPQSQVYDILQDARGYIWLATYGGGAARFDGTSFELLSDISDAPHYRVVYDIYEDRSGKLWFATGNGVLCYDGFATKAMSTEDGLADNRVQSIIEDKNGTMWFGTASGVSTFDGESFTTYGREDGLPHPSVWDIVEDENGVLWFGTQGGVGRFDGTFQHLPRFDQVFVRDLAHDAQGQLWFGTDEGLFVQNGESYKHFTMEDGLPDLLVHSLLFDEDDTLLIGTQEGLAKFADGDLAPLSSLAFDDIPIWSLGGDNEGNLWVGTSGNGVFKQSPSPFVHLNVQDGLPDDVVWNFTQTRDGAIWIGTLNGLARYRDGEVKAFDVADGLLADEVRVVHEDKAGTLWIGTASGIQVYDDGKFSTPPPLKAMDTKVRSIYEEDDGLWFLSEDGVLFFDGSETQFIAKEKLGSRPNAMLRDTEGNLWFATLDGVVQLKDDQVIRYGVKDGIAHPASLSIALGPSNNIWVGTYGGISLIQPATENQALKIDTIT
ncbi:MAG: two-component regulator propeller domain-containing protein, partial [Bacteroidota bacterium]